MKWNLESSKKNHAEFFNPFVYTTKSSSVADIFVACMHTIRRANPPSHFTRSKNKTHTHTLFFLAHCSVHFISFAARDYIQPEKTSALQRKNTTKRALNMEQLSQPICHCAIFSYSMHEKSTAHPFHSILEEIQCALCLR